MKKLLVLICVLFLVGCAAEAPQQEVKEEEKAAEPASPPTTITEVDKPAESLSPELEALLGKADEKVKNIKGKSGGYQFFYAPPPDNLARDMWFIKGNKIVVKLYEENVVQADLNYDTIYLDTSAKTAEAYCEDERSPRCPDKNKQFSVDYNEVMIKTPYQWLKEIKTGEIVSGEMLWDRKVEVVEYTEGNTVYKQWIDGFSGLPVKVRIGRGPDAEEYQFRDLAVNTVIEAQLEH